MINIQDQIIQIIPGLFYVDTEPGDATHYRFLVYCDGPDYFTIAPRTNTFRYPQKMSRFDETEEDFIRIAEEFSCNPCTVKECARVIQIIIN